MHPKTPRPGASRCFLRVSGLINGRIYVESHFDFFTRPRPGGTERAMNLLPGLQIVLDELTHRFGAQIEDARAPQPNELYLHAPAGTGRRALLRRSTKNTRAASPACSPRTPAPDTNVFFVYHLYALDADPRICSGARAGPGGQTGAASLTNAVPAANWQEREIQDLFGIKLVGHPNPRRCVLHDDWPEVYPLRKDFDLRTVLPPFTRRAPQVPRGRGRRRVPGAGRPGPRGHH